LIILRLNTVCLAELPKCRRVFVLLTALSSRPLQQGVRVGRAPLPLCQKTYAGQRIFGRGPCWLLRRSFIILAPPHSLTSGYRFTMGSFLALRGVARVKSVNAEFLLPLVTYSVAFKSCGDLMSVLDLERGPPGTTDYWLPGRAKAGRECKQPRKGREGATPMVGPLGSSFRLGYISKFQQVSWPVPLEIDLYCN
jgi:hypothetical protein